MSSYQGLLLIKTTCITQELIRRYLKLNYDTIGIIKYKNNNHIIYTKSLFDYVDNVVFNSLTWIELTKHSCVKMIHLYPVNNIDELTFRFNTLTPLSPNDTLKHIVSYKSNEILNYTKSTPIIIENTMNSEYIDKDKFLLLSTHFLKMLLVDNTFKNEVFKVSPSHDYPLWVNTIKDSYLTNQIPVISINDIITLVNTTKNLNIEYLPPNEPKYAILVPSVSDFSVDLNGISINLDNPELSTLTLNDLNNLRVTLNVPLLINDKKYDNLRQYIDLNIFRKYN